MNSNDLIESPSYSSLLMMPQGGEVYQVPIIKCSSKVTNFKVIGLKTSKEVVPLNQ